jgi:CheY-like chemotaxis protein
VRISVADTGVGMDAETRHKAREAFFTTKGPGEGTGLGLASVATMMAQFSGQLEIESEVGVGTTVRLYFPRAVVLPAPAAVPDAAEPVPDAPGGERILLVEDELLVRVGVQHMLEELGYVVSAAKDPDAALKLLESDGGGTQLLLTDVLLPGMSGPELAVVVKERRPGIRVLYMSAFPTEELIAQKRIEPGSVTLEKPFTLEQMATGVRAALKGSDPAA